jgi:hypothetical protein
MTVCIRVGAKGILWLVAGEVLKKAGEAFDEYVAFLVFMGFSGMSNHLKRRMNVSKRKKGG